MPLFPGVTGNVYAKDKTHTGLVVSEGIAPAEKLIVDKTEGVKFSYAYGPEGNQNVVLAKGKAVTLGAAAWDSVTERNYPTIKTAPSGSKNVVGINHHNLYEVKRDRFSGNQATVITRQYIELPFFEHSVLNTAQSYADAMKFGAVYGQTGGSALKPGDYVKVGVNGNLVKLDDASDSPFQIVGQVWAVERELPPAGLLEYFLDMKIEEIESFLKGASHAPSPGANGTIRPFYPGQIGAPAGGTGDAGAYPFGYPWALQAWKGDFEKLLNPIINKGIPFLTDGYFKAKQVVTNISLDDIYNASSNNDGQIENVVFSGAVTYITPNLTTNVYDNAAAGVITPDLKTDANTRNNAIFIKLRHEIDKYELDQLQVKYSVNTLAGGSETVGSGQVFSANDVHIDYTNNMIVVYLAPGQQYNDIKLDVPMVVDPVIGTPTEWDYTGCVGAVRILLQR